MRTKYRKDTRKCPRCSNVALLRQKKCEECGLVFERLNQATNKQAKKQFFNKDKSIVMVTDFPKDVVRWKMILLCFFLGLFGAHNLAVGRYYRGFYMLIVGLISVVLSSLINPGLWYYQFMSIFMFFPAILAIFWIYDLFNLCFHRFKVPVALEVD